MCKDIDFTPFLFQTKVQVTMGWFSADEIVAAPAAASASEGHYTAQSVSPCILATVAVGYVVLRGLAKIHRQLTERVAERTTRRVAAQV